MEQRFSDAERQRLISLALQAWAHQPDAMLRQIIAKLTGTDTVLIAQRAYSG